MNKIILTLALVWTTALHAGWVDGGKVSNVGQYAEDKLRNAGDEGLNQRVYEDGIRAFDQLRNGQISPSAAEARFNKAFVQYIDDVRNGRFDPKQSTSRIYLRPDSVNPTAIIRAGLSSGGTGWIDQLPPQHPQYQKLKQALMSDYKAPSNARKQIEATMESWRWMPRNPGNRYLLINVPSFDLRAYENGQEVLRSVVIVGNQKNQTPIFAAEIPDLIFNPEWRVPAGIVKEELLPMGMDYLTRNGFRRSGTGLTQASGKNNALGRLRFSIVSKGTGSNPFGIYLHDTSNPELYAEADRSLGHGCVRIEEAPSVAEFIFNDCNEWPVQEVDDMMDRSHTNQKVPLRSRMPVLIAYLNVWADDNGSVNFYNDPYGLNDQIMAKIG